MDLVSFGTIPLWRFLKFRFVMRNFLTYSIHALGRFISTQCYKAKNVNNLIPKPLRPRAKAVLSKNRKWPSLSRTARGNQSISDFNRYFMCKNVPDSIDQSLWYSMLFGNVKPAFQFSRAFVVLLSLLTFNMAIGQTDLQLLKTSSISSSTIGSQITFTLSVVNQHASVGATSVTVSDPIPANTSYVSSSGDGIYSNGSGVWTVGNIAALDTATIEIVLLVTGEGVIFNLAEISGASPSDIDSSPSNGAFNEDDIASACVTVPIWLACDNTAGVTLSAPAGHSNYQWFRDGTLIPGQTTATLIATAVGSYTYTTDVQPAGCPGGNCCPVVVQKYACLGDLVWDDLNQNGLYDAATESGVGNITVQLFDLGIDGVKGTDDQLVNTTTTAVGTGNYAFTNIPPGNYYVMFSGLPTNFMFTSVDQGADDAIDSDANGMGMGAITALSPGETDNTHDAGIFLVPPTFFDLALVKTLSAGQPAIIEMGDTVSYTIEVKNQGTENAYAVSVSDYMPAGFTFDPALNPSWSLVSGVPTSTIAGPIAPNTSMFVSLSLVIGNTNLGGNSTNTAEISAADNDLITTNTPPNDIDSDGNTNPLDDTFGGDDITNNSNGDEDDSDISTVYVEIFDLAIAKILTPGQPPLVPGAPVDFTFTIYNQGNIAAMNIELVDFIPTGLILNDPDWMLTGNIAMFTHPALIQPGDSDQVHITFIIDPTFQGGILNNEGELAFAEDFNGNIRIDVDSDPNINPGDDPFGGDGVINNDNGDEDDSDPAPIMVVLPAELGNFVWYDTNGNGIQDLTEAGVPAVAVQLFSPGVDGIKGNADDVLEQSTTTNGTGNYSFTGIVPGPYYVMFNPATLPTGYTVATPNAGANPLVDSDANAMGMTPIIALGSGQVDMTIDMGIVPMPASIGNYVWNDTNNDGIQNPGEPVVPNVDIDLYNPGPDNIIGNADDIFVSTTTTSPTGFYNFGNLNPGSYYLVFDLMTIPVGFIPTVQNASGSTSGNNSDVNAMGMTGLITLAPGQAVVDIDLGIMPGCVVTLAQPDVFLCQDDSTLVRIVLNQPISSYTITATSGYRNVVVTGNTITFHAFLEGVLDNFTVTLVGLGGACQTTDVFTLNRISAPEATFIVNEPACSNDSVCLKFTGIASIGAILNWNVADGIIVSSSPATATQPAGANVCVRFPSPGARMLMLTVNDGGCTDVYTQGVNVKKSPTAIAGADRNICLGSSVLLTGTTAGGLNCWWEPNTPLSNTVPDCDTTVSPIVSTNYVYWVCDANNCKDSDTVRVNVIQITSAIVGTSPICLNQCSSLTASGGTIYAWSNGGTTANISVCPTVNTTYTVTVSDVTGCTATASYAVVVNPLPVVSITGPATICAGASTVLTALGGVSYVWNTGSTLASLLVNPTATSTYTLTATDAAGCTGVATHTVTVLPLPLANAGPDQNVCVGACGQLTATGGGTYVWNTGATTAAITVCPLVTTTYTVTVTGANGCTAVDEVVVTSVTANPNAGPDQTVCPGSAVMLQASGGGTYVWSNGPTTAMQVVKPLVTTTYTVTVTSPNGCTGTDQVTVNVNPAPNIQVPGATVCQGGCVDLTATGAVTYIWYPNACLNQVTGPTVKACPTETKTWVVTGIDINGCVDTAHVTVVVDSVFVSAGPDVTTCGGVSTTLSATPGGTSYLWSNGATTASITVNPIVTTTYTVTLTEASGCTAIDQVSVVVTPAPVAVIAGINTPCFGLPTTVTASGGTSYLWSTGATSAAITIVGGAATTYTVTVTGVSGCTDTETITITGQPLPVAAIAGVTTICPGASTTLTASGGTSYLWNNTATTSSITITPVATTVYTVTVTNAAGCTDTELVTVIVSPAPVAVISGSPNLCFGTTNTLTASGGSTYLWSTGSTANAITVNPSVATTYTVTVTTAAGCTDTESITVTPAPNPTVSIAPGDLSLCPGSAVWLAATATGGTPNYTYLWAPSTGLNTTVGDMVLASAMVTTTYIVTVTDSKGCTDTEDIVVTIKPSASTNAGPDQSLCGGGTAILTATGFGTFQWSNGGTSATTNVSPTVTTTYTVTVTTPDGCSATDQVVVSVGGLISASAGLDQNICSGGSSVILNALGGTSYLWNTGQTTASITVSPSFTTTYTVTISNASGCSAVDEVVVNVGASQFGSITSDLTVCPGGSANLTASGGSSYVWSTGSTTPTITVAPAATTTYFVTITSAFGCTDVEDVVVSVVTPSANAGPDQTICIGQSVTLTATGGSIYAWSNGIIGAATNVSPLVTTTYTVTVSPGGGCTATDQVLVTVQSSLTVQGTVTPASCGAANGTISVSVSGNSNVSYAWTPIGTGAMRTNLAAGTYTVTATDNASGCTGTATFAVGATAALDVTLIAGATSCTANTGNIAVTITGSTAPYGVAWSGAATGTASTPTNTYTINNLPQGIYTVTVSDANGCTDWASINVPSATPITATLNTTLANCCGQNGALDVVPSGGAGYTYVWSPNVSTTASASGLATGTYNVTVTSSNGCSVALTGSITPNCTGCQNIVAIDSVAATVADTIPVCFPGFSQSQLDYYDIFVNGTPYTGAYHACDYDTLAVYNYTNLLTTGSGPYQLTSWTCNGSIFSAASIASMTQLVDSMRIWDPAGNWNLNAASNNISGGIVNTVIYGPMNFVTLANSANTTINPNYVGQAMGTSILIPGTPGKHTIRLVDPVNCCADTLCVFVVPGSVNCTNFIAQATATAAAPDCASNANVCLDVQTSILITHTVAVNGLPYTGGYLGCNFDTAFTYVYSQVPNSGAAGPYTLNNWTVNGVPRTGIFNTIAQLVTMMNTWDPTGLWEQLPASLTIRGGATTSVYSNMSITQNATGGMANLQVGLSLNPLGMQLSLPTGTHKVMFTDKVNGCRDSIIVTITCPTPAPCASFIAASSITLPTANCATYLQNFCVEIPYLTLPNYNVKMNNLFYTGATAACSFNLQGNGTGTSFAVNTPGTHTFIFTHAGTGCSDTLIVNAPCFNLSPQYITSTIYKGEVDTVCLDMTELPGNVFTVSNACPSTNEFVLFDRLQGTVCYVCTGVEIGLEKVCFVLCDDQGNCDSTFMTINVLDRVQPLVAGVVDIDTTIANTRLIMDVLKNDTIPGGLTGFQVITQPQHGTVTKTADNKLAYLPFDEYCDSEVPDQFQYMVCNPVNCDTVKVFVWVLCEDIRIYSGFSPNNDMINDFFVIEGLENFQNNELTIYNRWGNQIYHKVKYDNSWDGTWNNEPLPDGTYFFLFNDGEGKKYTGYIQLMR
jgi:gliding motility-associated-like protein/uncharacterized repeat protein (TIGR01451 family)